MVQLKRVVALIWLLCLQTICAIDVEWDSQDSIKAAASQVAWDMMSYYKGNLSGQIPGLLPGPYYWWEAGAMFGALINYWHYTNDTTYNDVTMQAMQFQVGPHNDYMPPNETASLGNDDQAFWGIAAMQAAEYNFPNPPSGDPSWLSLAQAVYNEQIGRWLPQYCGGGIQWQIYEITGYDLKNSISNGCLFQLAARLARYTGTQSYADWAEKIWDWMWAIGLIGPEYEVYDNSEALRQNCSVIDKDQWCYNAGVMLMGAATMYNYTNGSEIWYNRTQGLMDMIANDYFPDGIMKDICEEYNACDVDQHSFKAYLSRWMTSSTQMAPWIYNTSITLLKSSAKAAAQQCIGSPNPNTGQSTGTICGLKWYLNGTWDGSNGVGQQMAALEVIIGTLVTPHQNVPLTNSTGGTSIGNPSAGFNASNIPPGEIIAPPSNTERGAAWFLTVFVSLLAVWTWWFLSSTTLERKGRHGPSIAGKKRRTLMKGKEKGLDSPSTGSGEVIAGGEIATPGETYAMKDRASRVINLNSDGRPVVPPHILHNRTSSMPLSPIVEGGTDYRRSGGMDRMDRRSVPIYRGGDLPT